MIFMLENVGLDQKKKRRSDFDIFSIVNCEYFMIGECIYKMVENLIKIANFKINISIRIIVRQAFEEV